MFTVLIQNENKNAFLPFIPDVFQGELESPDIIAVGLADENSVAVGAMIARVTEIWLDVIWLYTDERFRNEESNALFDRLKSFNKFVTELVGVFMNFRENAETERLFVENGFVISHSEQAIYEFTVGELAENSFWKSEARDTEGTEILENVPEVLLKKLDVTLSLSSAGIPIELPIDWQMYDNKLSTAYIKNGEIEGILLIERLGEAISLAFVYVNPGLAAAMPAMLYRSGNLAITTLPPETKVSLAAISNASEKLTKKLFPNLKPQSAKCAVYRYSEIYDEEEVSQND